MQAIGSERAAKPKSRRYNAVGWPRMNLCIHTHSRRLHRSKYAHIHIQVQNHMHVDLHFQAKDTHIQALSYTSSHLTCVDVHTYAACICCIYMYVYVYLYIYIYIHIHVYIHALLMHLSCEPLVLSCPRPQNCCQKLSSSRPELPGFRVKGLG